MPHHQKDIDQRAERRDTKRRRRRRPTDNRKSVRLIAKLSSQPKRKK